MKSFINNTARAISDHAIVRIYKEGRWGVSFCLNYAHPGESPICAQIDVSADYRIKVPDDNDGSVVKFEVIDLLIKENNL